MDKEYFLFFLLFGCFILLVICLSWADFSSIKIPFSG